MNELEELYKRSYNLSKKWVDSLIVPSVVSHSNINRFGVESICVCIKRPNVEKYGLESGGMYVMFVVDHIKQRTEVLSYNTVNGTPRCAENKLATINGDVFDESMCLQWVNNNKVS